MGRSGNRAYMVNRWEWGTCSNGRPIDGLPIHGQSDGAIPAIEGHLEKVDGTLPSLNLKCLSRAANFDEDRSWAVGGCDDRNNVPRTLER